MEKFTKIRNIGKGNMGACALARNNEDQKYYVIKQVDLTRMNKKERQQSLNEARVLSSLKHPNIINYVDSFLAKKSDHLCIVMEFADGGDLCGRIKKNYGVHFRESQVLDWFIQLVLSLNFTHHRKILHRDVKTQNIFLTSENVVKLGDFGIARALAGTYDQAKTFVGTPYYLSPELILEQPYDHRSDIWAAGVVLYELMSLKHPFNANDMKGLMQRILKVQYDPLPMMYSTEMRNLVPRLLMRDPSQRLSFDAVLELPIIHKRMKEWLDGDILPTTYLNSLLELKLLPDSIMQLAIERGQSSSRLSHSTAPSMEAARTQSQTPLLSIHVNPTPQSSSCNTTPRPHYQGGDHYISSTPPPPQSVPTAPARSNLPSNHVSPFPRADRLPQGRPSYGFQGANAQYSRKPMPLTPNPSPQMSSNSSPSTGRLGKLDDFYHKLNQFQTPQGGRLQPFNGAHQSSSSSRSGSFDKAPSYTKPSNQLDIRAMLQRAAADRAQRIQRAQYGV